MENIWKGSGNFLGIKLNLFGSCFWAMFFGRCIFLGLVLDLGFGFECMKKSFSLNLHVGRRIFGFGFSLIQ